MLEFHPKSPLVREVSQFMFWAIRIFVIGCLLSAITVASSVLSLRQGLGLSIVSSGCAMLYFFGYFLRIHSDDDKEEKKIRFLEANCIGAAALIPLVVGCNLLGITDHGQRPWIIFAIQIGTFSLVYIHTRDRRSIIAPTGAMNRITWFLRELVFLR